MSSLINDFIENLKNGTKDIEFTQVLELIDQHYDFSPTGFNNGTQRNEAGENSGSCKVLSFAELHSLTQEQALALFAQYYQDVKNTPEADDHQNIRQFIEHGFGGLSFDAQALSAK